MALFFRTSTILDTGALCDAQNNPGYQPPALSPDMCRIVAIILHYLYAVHFLTLFLEVRCFVANSVDLS
jgi:hypothetical protein